jgi:hypothetical protein
VVEANSICLLVNFKDLETLGRLIYLHLFKPTWEKDKPF